MTRTTAPQDRSSGTPIERYGHHIAGNSVLPEHGGTFESINPTIGRPWAEFSMGDNSIVDAAVSAAEDAFESATWRALSPTRRGRLMMAWGIATSHRTKSERRRNAQPYDLVNMGKSANITVHKAGLSDK
jgi:hypothetical protein